MKIFLIQRLISVFDTYVTSIVNDGCEVWGFHKGSDIETLHLYYLKRILKVRKSTVEWMNEWMNEFFICKKHIHAIAIKQIYTHVTQWQTAENN